MKIIFTVDTTYACVGWDSNLQPLGLQYPNRAQMS